MRKFLSRALIATALAALPSVALAQRFPGGGGISGISGACPSFSSTATIAGGISPSARSPVTGASDTLLAADCGEITEYSGATATAVTVPQAGSAGFPATFFTTVFVPVGAATRTFTTAASVFSNTGTTSFTLTAGESATLWSDGVNWGVMVGTGNVGTLTPSGSITVGNLAVWASSTSLRAYALSSTALAALANTANASGGVALVNGSIVDGNCLKWSTASGITDAGAVCGSGGGGVSSVSNSDGSLSVSPTTGSVVASVNYGTVAYTAAQGNDARLANAALEMNPVANFWYVAYSPTAPTNTATAMVAGTTYLYPIYIPKPITISNFGVRVSTGATASWTVALYANSGNRPTGSPLTYVTSSSTSTSYLTLAISGNYSITAAGWYWLGFQAGDTSMRNYTIPGGQIIAPNMGASTLGNSLGSTIGVSTTQSGTPPNLSSASFSEITAAPWVPAIAVEVYSVP